MKERERIRSESSCSNEFIKKRDKLTQIAVNVQKKKKKKDAQQSNRQQHGTTQAVLFGYVHTALLANLYMTSISVCTGV